MRDVTVPLPIPSRDLELVRYADRELPLVVHDLARFLWRAEKTLHGHSLSGSACPQRVGSEQRETGASLRARLKAFAEGRPLPDVEFVPPSPPPDPFASTGCIRIGEADAMALDLPLFGRFKQFGLYAPASTD